jgi:hypothetical protein
MIFCVTSRTAFTTYVLIRMMATTDPDDPPPLAAFVTNDLPEFYKKFISNVATYLTITVAR